MFVATIYTEVLYLKATMVIPQEWMATLTACGKKFKTDPVTGLYYFDSKNPAFMLQEGLKIGVPFLIWGSYVGLVLFRRFGRGRSPYNHFTSERNWCKKLVYVVLNYMMFKMAVSVQELTDSNKQSFMVKAIVGRMIPMFFFGFWGTFILPATTSRLLHYPLRIEDERFAAEDDEKFLSEQPTLLEEQKDRANGKSLFAGNLPSDL